MEALLFIIPLVEDFSSSLIPFCKPRMISPQKRRIASILNMETDLRMTLENATQSIPPLDRYHAIVLSREGVENLIQELSSFQQEEEESLLPLLAGAQQILEMLRNCEQKALLEIS